MDRKTVKIRTGKGRKAEGEMDRKTVKMKNKGRQKSRGRNG